MPGSSFAASWGREVMAEAARPSEKNGWLKKGIGKYGEILDMVKNDMKKKSLNFWTSKSLPKLAVVCSGKSPLAMGEGWLSIARSVPERKT